MPSLSKSLIWAGAFVLFFLAAVPVIQNAPVSLLSTGLAFGIISLSLVLLTGYAGDINLAPLTFAGIGAIVAQQFDVGNSARSEFSIVGIIFLILVGAAVGWAVGLIFRKSYGRKAVAISTVVFAVLGGVSAIWLEGESSGVYSRERMSLTGILVVAAVCALVGAIVALPALRLRGLYLGLATFAFAVFVTNMVFKQRSTLNLNIPWVGDGEDFGINFFTGGAVFIPRPSWLGIDFQDQDNRKAYMVLLAAVFAIIGLGLVLLRRSAYGRQLAAMKDSPAACATLGLNIVRLKLSVFALSSAIAGVGGVFYVGITGTANEDSFFIFASLPIVLLLVVAGIGYVSGAFAGGILAGVFFVMMSDVFDKLSTDYSAFEWLFNDVLNNFFFFVGTAFAALTLASSPGGFLNDMFSSYRPLTTRKGLPLLVAWGVFQGLFYWSLNLQWVGMWTFMLISLGVALVLPVIAQILVPSLYVDEEVLRKRKEATPAELVGIDRDFTQDDMAEMNEALDLPANLTDADRRPD